MQQIFEFGFFGFQDFDDPESFFQEEADPSAMNALKNEAKDFQNKIFEFKNQVRKIDRDLYRYGLTADSLSCFIEQNSVYIRKLHQELTVAIQGINQDFSVDTNSLLVDLLEFLSQIRNNTAVLKNNIRNGTSYIRIYIEKILSEMENELRSILNDPNQNYSFLKFLLEQVKTEFNIFQEHIQNLNKQKMICENQLKFIDNQVKNLKISTQKFANMYSQSKMTMSSVYIPGGGGRPSGRPQQPSNLDAIKEEEESVDNKPRPSPQPSQPQVKPSPKPAAAPSSKAFVNMSTLIGVTDLGKLQDFQSVNLFGKRGQADVKDEWADAPDLVKKNWHEVVYIYDDYDEHDIKYVLKPVGLDSRTYFPSFSHYFSFYPSDKFQVKKFEIDGKNAQYSFDQKSKGIKVQRKVQGSDELQIHIVYQVSQDLSKLKPDEKQKMRYMRAKEYGLGTDLGGHMAKYVLIPKGSFQPISFDKELFIKKKNEKGENEYMWGGEVPIDGYKTLVRLSKKEGKWSFDFRYKVVSNGKLKGVKLTFPQGLQDGNNQLVNYSCTSQQTKNITLDKERRMYTVIFPDGATNNGEVIVKGVLKNRCTGSWDVPLSDSQIEELTDEDYKKNKNQYKAIAERIIKEFDQQNKDTFHYFLDYYKIGQWVKKNIEYDLDYTGRTKMTAMDIYNQKRGVCHHMTKLSNALLYALGHKVLYISGYACENGEISTENGHAWSLIYENGKWYPFDSTWGILSGKLPVCHVFFGFNNESSNVTSYCQLRLSSSRTGKFED